MSGCGCGSAAHQTVDGCGCLSCAVARAEAERGQRRPKPHESASPVNALTGNGGGLQYVVTAGPTIEQGPTEKPDPEPVLPDFPTPQPPGEEALLARIQEAQERQEELRDFVRGLRALAGSRQRVQCFFLDYYHDTGYVAPTSWQARRETLEYCWAQFLSDVKAFEGKSGFDEDKWYELVNHNDVADEAGAFFHEGVGAGALKWTICALVSYSCLLETSYISNTGCDTSLAAIRAWIESWRLNNFLSPGLWVSKVPQQVDGTYAVHLADCGLPYHVEQVGTTSAQAAANDLSLEIHLDPSFLLALGQFGDHWLAAAHQLYWARKEAGATAAHDAATIADQIFRAGAIALAPVVDIAQTLVHEFSHLATATHCETGCCQSVVQAQWYACVASRNGVVAGPYSSAPDGLGSSGLAYSPAGTIKIKTVCNDALPSSDEGAWVTTVARLRAPGRLAGYGEWSLQVSRPPDCE